MKTGLSINPVSFFYLSKKQENNDFCKLADLAKLYTNPIS